MRRRAERGAVTAELALGLPLLLVITWTLAWLLSVVVVQIRVVDAAREAARALARGDEPGQALALARQVAPDGAAITFSWGPPVTVTVVSQASPPAGSLFSLGVRVRGEAVALPEDDGRGIADH